MVPFINSGKMRQEEKINGGCFQMTKRNDEHFWILSVAPVLFSISNTQITVRIKSYEGLNRN